MTHSAPEQSPRLRCAPRTRQPARRLLQSLTQRQSKSRTRRDAALSPRQGRGDSVAQRRLARPRLARPPLTARFRVGAAEQVEPAVRRRREADAVASGGGRAGRVERRPGGGVWVEAPEVVEGGWAVRGKLSWWADLRVERFVPVA